MRRTAYQLKEATLRSLNPHSHPGNRLTAAGEQAFEAAQKRHQSPTVSEQNLQVVAEVIPQNSNSKRAKLFTPATNSKAVLPDERRLHWTSAHSSGMKFASLLATKRSEDHKMLQYSSVQVDAIWSCGRLLHRTKPLTCLDTHFSTLFITFLGEYGFSVIKEYNNSVQL